MYWRCFKLIRNSRSFETRADPSTITSGPTTSNATSLASTSSLRAQTSQHSLRSSVGAAPARSRQQLDLFAPSLSRRPTSRATPRVEDEVLADSDSEPELAAQRQRNPRRVRHGSPDGKHGRLKGKQEEEHEFVNRKADGSYLLGGTGFSEAVTVPNMSAPTTEEEIEQAGEHMVHQVNGSHLT